MLTATARMRFFMAQVLLIMTVTCSMLQVMAMAMPYMSVTSHQTAADLRCSRFMRRVLTDGICTMPQQVRYYTLQLVAVTTVAA